MLIDASQARLPLQPGQAARLKSARDARLTAMRGIAWITIDGDRRDIVLAPGDSFVVDSDAPVIVYPLRAGDGLMLAIDTATQRPEPPFRPSMSLTSA